MNLTKQQTLNSIAKLIESGEASVEFDDIKITNRSLNELLRIERRLQARAAGRQRQSLSGVLPEISRGVE